MYKTALLLVFLSFMLGACKRSRQEPAIAAAAFFDLKQYFEAEAARLEQQELRGIKTVRLNEREETQAFSKLVFTEEFAPFLYSGINKPSWMDKYQVDSLYQGDRLQEVRYMARDSSLKTRELRVRYQENAVSEIWIRNLIRSIISTSEQELSYIPGEGYVIEGLQGGRLGAPKRFSVKVQFEEK